MTYEIWVKPVTCDGFIPGPTPERAKLDEDEFYRVIEIYDSGDILSEAYFSVINGSGELWFVSTRHFRIVKINYPGTGIPLEWVISVDT